MRIKSSLIAMCIAAASYGVCDDVTIGDLVNVYGDEYDMLVAEYIANLGDNPKPVEAAANETQDEMLVRSFINARIVMGDNITNLAEIVSDTLYYDGWVAGDLFMTVVHFGTSHLFFNGSAEAFLSDNQKEAGCKLDYSTRVLVLESSVKEANLLNHSCGQMLISAGQHSNPSPVGFRTEMRNNQQYYSHDMISDVTKICPKYGAVFRAGFREVRHADMSLNELFVAKTNEWPELVVEWNSIGALERDYAKTRGDRGLRCVEGSDYSAEGLNKRAIILSEWIIYGFVNYHSLGSYNICSEYRPVGWAKPFILKSKPLPKEKVIELAKTAGDGAAIPRTEFVQKRVCSDEEAAKGAARNRAARVVMLASLLDGFEGFDETNKVVTILGLGKVAYADRHMIPRLDDGIYERYFEPFCDKVAKSDKYTDLVRFAAITGVNILQYDSYIDFIFDVSADKARLAKIQNDVYYAVMYGVSRNKVAREAFARRIDEANPSYFAEHPDVARLFNQWCRLDGGAEHSSGAQNPSSAVGCADNM